ncbi:hypothetical protein QBC45DRAFT_414922 [Copromyces sp. CBS 386.78]|nr:hypothetical protein QBC45DRAFT_414922 [Copromyces sp. CBS 386.78]
MSRPSRPNFLQPARSAPAPASVTNTNVTAAMVSIPSDVDIDVGDPEYHSHHDTEHRPSPGPGSVTATSTTTGRASSAFSLPFFAGSAASKRSTAPTTVSSVSTAPGPIVPVPNVHAQAYTGQVVPPAAGSTSTTTTTGSSTSGASTTTTTNTNTNTNARRSAPAFPPPSQSQSQTFRPGAQQAPHTPRTPTATGTSTLPTAQARTAVLASISNLLDRELTGRASLLHQNHNAILKQEREMTKAVEGFKKDNDKLEKLAREGTKKLKEVGDVQNWAEVLERGFLRVEETIRRANHDWGSEDGSWSGSYSGSDYSGSWSGSEREDGDERVRDGESERKDGKGDGVKRENGGQQGEIVGSGSKAPKGEEKAVEAKGVDGEREEVTRDAEGDVVMTTEDDVQERHTKLDKGKGKAVDDTITEPSMVPLPRSPELSDPGGAQFPSLPPAAV